MEQAPSTEKQAIIDILNVSKWFPDPKNHAERLVSVNNITLSIADEEGGEFVVLLGPSGCGKSTLLNMIAGMHLPDEGDVSVFGKPLTGPNPDSVTVPQNYTCFPWLTVQANVEFGLSLQNKTAAERSDIARQYLDKVGLLDRAAAYPDELSGGMKQRVAIARSLAMRLPILLMDEPFGALDAQTRTEMQQMLVSLWQQEKSLIVFITHDISEALLLADRIIVLSARPAEILEDIKVPFARPRLPSLTMEKDFVDLSQALLHLLKKSPNSGKICMTV